MPAPQSDRPRAASALAATRCTLVKWALTPRRSPGRRRGRGRTASLSRWGRPIRRKKVGGRTGGLSATHHPVSENDRENLLKSEARIANTSSDGDRDCGILRARDSGRQLPLPLRAPRAPRRRLRWAADRPSLGPLDTPGRALPFDPAALHPAAWPLGDFADRGGRSGAV